MLDLEPSRMLDIMLVHRQRKMSLVAETYASAIRDRLMNFGERVKHSRRRIYFRYNAISHFDTPLATPLIQSRRRQHEGKWRLGPAIGGLRQPCTT